MLDAFTNAHTHSFRNIHLSSLSLLQPDNFLHFFGSTVKGNGIKTNGFCIYIYIFFLSGLSRTVDLEIVVDSFTHRVNLMEGRS